MTKKTLLDFRLYGIFEFILMLILTAIFILVQVLNIGMTYSVITSLILLLIAVLTSIYMFFFKTKASAFLNVVAVRWFLLTMITILANFQVGLDSELDIIELYWLVGSIMVAVVTIIIAFHYANQRWNELVAETWKNNKKIDIANARFKIMTPGYVTEKKKNSKLLPNVFLISFIGFLVLRILTFLGGEGFSHFMDRLIPWMLTVASSFILATYLCQAINVLKIEREMNFQFLTEYADSEELALLSKEEW